MVLKKQITKLLLVALLFAFALAGCLGGDAPETDDGNDDTQDTDDLPEEDDEEGGGDSAGGGDDGGPDGGDGGDGGENGGGDGGKDEQEEECIVSRENVTGWSHDGPAVPDPTGFDPEGDPLMLIAATTNETFTVAEGTESLVIDAGAGLHVTLGWNLAVLDPAGAEAYSFAVEPGAGENVTDSATVSAPAPGEWTLATSVTGYVEGLSINVDADVCS